MIESYLIGYLAGCETEFPMIGAHTGISKLTSFKNADGLWRGMMSKLQVDNVLLIVGYAC